MKPILFAILILTADLLAQQNIENGFSIKKNSIFLEAGGLAVVGSINYERRFLLQNNFYLATQFGYGGLKLNTTSQRIPVHFKVGKVFNKKCLEIGVAYIPYDFKLNDLSKYAIGIELNLLHYFTNTPIFFGGTFSPIVFDSDGSAELWGGAKFGFYF